MPENSNIKTESLRILLSFLCCLFGFSPELRAQQNFDIRYGFEQDTVWIEGGQTFSNKVVIENLTDRRIELAPSSNQTMALQGMIKLPDQIVLEANEKKSFPLKYIADRHTIANKVQAFTIGLSADDKTLRIAPAASFHTNLAEDRQFSLSTEQSEYYFDVSGEPIQFMVHAANRGLVPVAFRLAFAEVPEGLEFTGETMSTSLQPSAQVLLPFTATVRSRNKVADFNVTIQALDENGNLLASRRIRIMNIGSVKRFGAGNNFLDERYQNSVALRYMSMSHHSSIYQIQGNGELAFDDRSGLKYRLNLDYYQNQEAINIYDTYLDYENKDWGVKLGNIYENLDYTLSGRGIKASYHFGEDRTISVYGVENNYMLVSQLNNLIPGEKIMAAQYTFNAAQNQQGNLTFLHSNNTYRRVNSNLVSGRTHLNVGGGQQLGVEGGYSVESAYHGSRKHAIAMGVHYNYNFKDYQFTSNNYYSSPYYSGLRRGLIQSDSRISKMLQGGKNVTARISFMDNNPQYQGEQNRFYFNSHNRIQIYELGYNTRLGELNMNLRPYFMLQDLKSSGLSLYQTRNAQWSSKSVRAVADFSFFSDSHRFSINTDYGYTYENTADRPLAPFHSVRINGNYRNRLFGFNTYIQINPYYLSDLLTSSHRNNYQLYSLGPSTQFSAFRNALHVQMSAMYSYYGFSQTNNLSLTGSARWRMKANWSLTADVFYALLQTRMPHDLQYYTNVATRSFNNRQIRVGIEKQFMQKNNAHGHRLQLHYFEDQNNNGIKDKNEPAVEGILVKINKDVALSDNKGRVKFQNMPTGSYSVLIENNQGWSSPAPVDVLITKNQSLEIPLVKTKILRGKIKVIANKYQETKPALSGIRINAVSENGREYSTLSNAEGNYAFYLPPGIYTVFITTEGLPFSIENGKNEIELKDDGTEALLDFHYKDERRKIGIKRF